MNWGGLFVVLGVVAFAIAAAPWGLLALIPLVIMCME